MERIALRVERIACARHWAELRDEWNALAGEIPFRSFEWLECWWRHYGADRPDWELAILAVRDSQGDLLGVAPWYLERSMCQGNRLLPLGSGEVCSEYVSVFTHPSYVRQVSQAIAQWLATARQERRLNWERLELGLIPDDDRATGALVLWLQQLGQRCVRKLGNCAWQIALPLTWEEYLQQLSKSHRKQVLRLCRRVLEPGRVQLHIAQDAAQLQRGLAILTELHRRRRNSLGEAGCFVSDRFTSFHAEIARQLLAQGHLRLYWIEFAGRPIAAEYQILRGGTLSAYQSGIEPALLDQEPGRLITIATIQQAIAEGATTYDLLRGDEAYKAHWRAEPLLGSTLTIIAPRLLPSLRFRTGRVVRTVGKWLHSAMSRFTRPALAPVAPTSAGDSADASQEVTR